MKVGLMTFHNAMNYGAALQVYASQQAINNLGVDCEVINYVNEHRDNAYDMSYHVKSNMQKRNYKAVIKYSIGSFFMNKRRKNFLKFYRNNLQCTEKIYRTSEEAEELNPIYDKFIIGSDQVWNYSNNGEDFAYFLNFVEEDNKKIAYSSSFGLSSIPEKFKKEYAENLTKIKYLSSRESIGLALIKDLTGRQAKLVLDPVFLLDKSQWTNLCKKKTSKEKYIFCYTNKTRQFNDFISQTKYPLKDYSIHKLTSHLGVEDFLNPKVKVSYTISPVEFIETILHAELVVSASFHCIAMAMILNVPFVAILTGDRGKDERVLNILKITDLEHRILNKDMTYNDVMEPIDFHKVESKIEIYKNESLEYLKNSIYDNKFKKTL